MFYSSGAIVKISVRHRGVAGGQDSGESPLTQMCCRVVQSSLNPGLYRLSSLQRAVKRFNFKFVYDKLQDVLKMRCKKTLLF